jgi:hypothetical protein
VHRSKSTGSLDRFDPSAASNKAPPSLPCCSTYVTGRDRGNAQRARQRSDTVQLDTRSSGKGAETSASNRWQAVHPRRRILYADDMQILAHTPEALQDMLNAYDAVLSAYGMVISQTKTKVMVYRPLEPVTRCQHHPAYHRTSTNTTNRGSWWVTDDGGSGEGRRQL